MFVFPFSNIAQIILGNFLHTPRHRGIPPWDHTWATHYRSRDQLPLQGWAHRPPGATAGTVFLFHGYFSHCGNPRHWELARHIAAKFSAVVCAVDLRHHGRSGNALPTFGLAESWDIQATLDEAERYSSPKPFVLIGDSLGGLAAQRAAIEDPRVSGAILIHTPGWPWDAIGKAIQSCLRLRVVTDAVVGLVGGLINSSYGRDVLTAGDIRRLYGHPAHHPRVLYLMGTRDHFDIGQTRKVYDHWYHGIPATWNVWPADDPMEKKWFITVDDAAHPPAPYTVYQWEHFGRVIDQFIGMVLQQAIE